MTIHSLSDRQFPELPQLGNLIYNEQPDCIAVGLDKQVELAGLGSYRRPIHAPALTEKQLRRWLAERPEESGPYPCLGVIAAGKFSAQPIGTVDRLQGCHLYRVPVYSPGTFGSLGWAEKLALLTDRGYVVLCVRQTGYWIRVAIVALLLGCAAFFLFLLGPRGCLEAAKALLSSPVV